MAPVFLNNMINIIIKLQNLMHTSILNCLLRLLIFASSSNAYNIKLVIEQLHFHSNIEMNEQRNEAFMAARALKKVCNKFSYFICLSFPFYFLAIFEVFFLFYFRLQSCTVVVRINIF